MKRESGYALIVILLLLAFVLISLSVAIPPLLTLAQREKEEELLFRGEQYQRAVGRFYRKFGRYPLKVDELLWTNDRAFLRRPYPDPMTSNGNWRILRLGPAGQIVGSKHQVKAPEPEQPRRPRGRQPARSGSQSQRQSTSQSQSSGSSMGSGGVNLPIVGVASTSDKLSIRIYNGYMRYDQWEFVYDPSKQALKTPAGATPGTDDKSGGKSGDKSKTKPKPSS